MTLAAVGLARDRGGQLLRPGDQQLRVSFEHGPLRFVAIEEALQDTQLGCGVAAGAIIVGFLGFVMRTGFAGAEARS